MGHDSLEPSNEKKHVPKYCPVVPVADGKSYGHIRACSPCYGWVVARWEEHKFENGTIP